MKRFVSLILLLAVSMAWAGSPAFLERDGVQVSLRKLQVTGNLQESPQDEVTPANEGLRNGNYAIACNLEEGGYIENMLNYITSPEINIPDGSVVEFDFFLAGEFGDPDEFPDVDYWGCELSIDGGVNWFYISNPYGDPEGDNYVYSDATGDWASFVNSYSLDGRLDDYAGETVIFRWYFQSDDDTPQGDGVYFDDISLTVDGNQVYFEDFEDGTMDPYVSFDGTATGPMWHQTTVNAYAGQSWAMNDPALGNSGGYLDHWYQTLDSPPVTIPPGEQTLTFMQNRNIESTAGAESPYDGWDGTNVRWSVDGVNWEILTDPTPAYNATSLYSFGLEFGEGAGIPGWGGATTDWEAVSFSIPGDLAGQDVQFRWAFASDPAQCTIDDPTYFGWLIDDINIANEYMNDGESDSGWVAASQVPIAGDLWHIAFVAELPPPVGLTAEAGDQVIDLAWSSPITGTSVPIAYDNAAAWRYYLNDSQPYAVIFDIEEDNTFLGEGQFYMYGNPFEGTVDIDVYSVSAGLPDAVLYTFEGVEVGDAWPVTVDLTQTGLSFNAGESFALAVGGFLGGTLNQGILVDSLSVENPAMEHSFVWGGDGWYAITDGYDDIANLAIRAEVIVPGGGLIPESYNLWRRTAATSFDMPIASEIIELVYTDTDVSNGVVYYYAVSANYVGGESALSAEASALPESQSVYTLMYDDGTAETGFNIGFGGFLGVKFTPEAYPVILKRVKLFTQGTGNTIGYIYDDDGVDGMPGTELKRLSLSGLLEGWNIVDIPDDTIWIEEGSFYFAQKDLSSTPSMGVDNNSTYAERAYFQAPAEDWMNLGELGIQYNVMFRADVDSAFVVVSIDQDEASQPQSYALAQNFPNPFNPTTEIRYSVPSAGPVQLTVYDLAGQEVVRLINEQQAAGSYRVMVDGSAMSSGVYLYTLSAGDTRLTRKMILLK